MNILMEIPVGMSGGYSKDGIGFTRALLERGHDVTLSPKGVHVPLPPDIAAMLSTEQWQPGPYDLRITHVAPVEVDLQRSAARDAKINVWVSMWEWENFPTEYADTLRQATKYFDHFVAYDQGSFDALAPHLTIPNKHICQGGFESEDWKMPDFPRAGKKKFVFGTLGDISARKNPSTLIAAFRKMKDKYPDTNADLLIKSRYALRGDVVGPFIDEEYGIFEMNGIWDREEMELFYHNLGAYVAPSYGEGKNLPALEAATNGVPLILSDVPGHVWAKSIDSAIFVGGERSCLRLAGIPVWGLKVDEDELAEAMYEVYSNQTEYENRARTNVPVVVQSMDWFKVVERLRHILELPTL